jgi:hypothetical protein
MEAQLADMLRGAGLYDLAGEIRMPKKAFVKEHKKLISLLRSSRSPRFQREADDQLAELKRMTGDMVAGSKASGFIQRMMWEAKHKHDGKYQPPTDPLAKDSTMNAPVPFRYSKLANKDQGGVNDDDYGASPFIIKHFGPATEKALSAALNAARKTKKGTKAAAAESVAAPAAAAEAPKSSKKAYKAKPYTGDMLDELDAALAEEEAPKKGAPIPPEKLAEVLRSPAWKSGIYDTPEEVYAEMLASKASKAAQRAAKKK